MSRYCGVLIAPGMRCLERTDGVGCSDHHPSRNGPPPQNLHTEEVIGQVTNAQLSTAWSWFKDEGRTRRDEAQDLTIISLDVIVSGDKREEYQVGKKYRVTLEGVDG